MTLVGCNRSSGPASRLTSWPPCCWIPIASELAVLQELDRPPSRAEESADLKWVRQSRRYPLWRVSHPFDEDVAVRLICWFPPDSATAVVALFSGDNKTIGDNWYDSAASRADPLIDQWKREKEQQT